MTNLVITCLGSIAFSWSCLMWQSQAHAADGAQRDSFASISVAPAGPKPRYDAGLCIEANRPVIARQSSQLDEEAVRALITRTSSAQAQRLLSLVGDDVMWWVRMTRRVDLLSLPQAFHEANHTLDLRLSACNDNKATYVFEGKTYLTDLTRGTVPPFAIAAEKIPAKFKNRPLGRYFTYFEQTQPLPGNDFTTLLDELNAYVSAGQLEMKLISTPLYPAFKEMKYKSVDGNIGGAADFMLYTLSYLKAVRERSPQAYKEIQSSPLFIAHLQRLWSASEHLLEDAAPYTTANGGIFQIGPDTLDTVYSSAYIDELDRLSVRHKHSIAL